MKFIHTADWHLGNRMHQTGRIKEESDFLHWLKDYIITSKADALFVAGDIFDTANPSVEARQLYFNFLASLVGSCCQNVIIVGGNHDSGMLLDSQREILDCLNIHVTGSLSNNSLEKMIVDLYSTDSEGKRKIAGICCALPFVRESELRLFYDGKDEDGSFSDKAYEKLYKKLLEKAKERQKEILEQGLGIEKNTKVPLFATGHLYAADLEGRPFIENESSSLEKIDDGVRSLDIAGNLGSVHAGVFPKEFDYVALGHIHYCTRVGKNPKIRYSGSPFVMGFDEAHIERKIILVECSENGGEVKSSLETVPAFVKYKRLSGSVSSIKKDLLKLIENICQGIEKGDEEAKKEYRLELYYQKSEGLNPDEAFSDLIEKLPENVRVISRKIMKSPSFYRAENIELDGDELRSLDSTEIYRNLILSKIERNEEFKSEEEKIKWEEEQINKYLPYFIEVENFVKKGMCSENENTED